MRSAVAFGRRLRTLRRAKGLTQRELAEPKYTHAYVSTIEAGRRRPSPECLAHFAERLGIETEELTSGRPPGLGDELRASLRAARVAASDGRLAESHEALEDVIGTARRYGIPRLEAEALVIDAIILERTGKPEQALEGYEEAGRLLVGDPPSAKASAIAGQARCLQSLGEVTYAIFLLEGLQRAIDADPSADAATTAQVRAAMLDAYIDAGLLRNAAEQAAALEVIAPRVDDPLRTGQVHLYLARLHATEGRTREAERALRASAEALGRSGLKTETAYARLALGIVFSRRSSFTKALQELEEARRIFDETHDVIHLTRTMIEIARAKRSLGRGAEAIDLVNEAIRLTRDADAPILAWAERELGTVYTASDPTLAEKHLRTAAELFERSDARVEAAITYRLLGDLFRDLGQPEAALEAYRDGISRIEPEPVG